MRYFNIILSASLLLVLCVLSAAPALAVADPFEPSQIALGPDGNIYALISGNDSTNNHIFVFAPDGKLVKTIDASASEIAFDAAGNLSMLDLAFGSGNTDKKIVKIGKDGNTTVLWNFGVNDSDKVIGCMAVGPDGKLYINEFDYQNPNVVPASQVSDESRIIRVDNDGSQQVVYRENITIAPGGFHSMAVDANGTIYAVGQANNFLIIAPDGTARTVGKFGSEDGRFSMITSITLGKDGYLYVTEYGNHRVQKLTTDGSYVMQWKGAGLDPFLYLYSAAVDESGRAYVADPHNERIVWLTPGYTFGENTTENLKGQGVTWGNVFQGTNYTTRLQEAISEKEPGSTPGFSPILSLTGIFLTGVVLCFWRVNKKR